MEVGSKLLKEENTFKTWVSNTKVTIAFMLRAPMLCRHLLPQPCRYYSANLHTYLTESLSSRFKRDSLSRGPLVVVQRWRWQTSGSDPVVQNLELHQTGNFISRTTLTPKAQTHYKMRKKFPQFSLMKREKNKEKFSWSMRKKVYDQHNFFPNQAIVIFIQLTLVKAYPLTLEFF